MRWIIVIIVALVLVVAPTASSPPQDAGSDPEATAKELKEFVPTEEITADSAVSFPVDI